MATLNVSAEDFIITRKRKKYKFAKFAETPNCFEVDQWTRPSLSKPIVVELGAGTGYFSVELASRHPDQRYVAVDVKADRLQAGARRALEKGIDNVSFVRAHAEQLPDIFSDRTIERLWLTFSDPYPKARHAKHRITHPRFLAMYKQLLAENGVLSIKTDNHQLFDWSLEQFVSTRWQLLAHTYDLHQSHWHEDYRFMTTFEERFAADGLPIYAAEVSPSR